MRPVSAKILENTEGLGVPSQASVDQRATELAMIDGRDSFNQEDWRLAFLELHGGNHYPLEKLEIIRSEEMGSLTSASVSVPSLGHQTPNIEYEGGYNIGEELVAEGLDEALHNRMLAARLEIEPDEREEI